MFLLIDDEGFPFVAVVVAVLVAVTIIVDVVVAVVVAVNFSNVLELSYRQIFGSFFSFLLILPFFPSTNPFFTDSVYLFHGLLFSKEKNPLVEKNCNDQCNGSAKHFVGIAL